MEGALYLTNLMATSISQTYQAHSRLRAFALYLWSSGGSEAIQDSPPISSSQQRI